MATKGGVEVIGADRLALTFAAAARKFADLHEVNARAAARLVAASTARAPRRTGALAGSVRSTGVKAAGVVRAGGASIPYAGVIHSGWPRRHIRPQPWLMDAGEATTDERMRMYRSETIKILNSVHGAT